MSITAATPGATSRLHPAIVPTLLGGGIILLGGLMTETTQALAGLVVAGVFAVTLPLGAALLMAIAITVGARWWHGLEGVMSDAARAIVVPAAFVGIVLLVGAHQLYPWAGPETTSHLVHMKHGWLNLPFFMLRVVLVLVVWVVLIAALVRRVRHAFEQPSPDATSSMARVAVAFCLLFALTISVAWWDWLMSLEPEWFSTMQGVYGFSSTFLGGIALVTLMALHRYRRGELALREDQIHDLGKFVFAFTFFWGYIWFCQFMLIWYADIPEESGWFVHRLSGGWSALFVLNAVVTFAIPFVALMSAKAKRHVPTLFQVTTIVLVGRLLDVWLAVGPSIESAPYVPVYVVAATAVIAAATLHPRARIP